MEMPFNEVCDKYTIALLKQKRLKDSIYDVQVTKYKEEIDNMFSTVDSINQLRLSMYIEELHSANKRVWDAEYDIRMGLFDDMPIEEFKPVDDFEKEYIELILKFLKESKDMVMVEYFQENWRYVINGRRLITCRESNSLRIMYKNRIAELVGQEEFKDLKVDHASTDGEKKKK